MKYLHPVAFVPNDLIKDCALHFTTKKVAVVLLLLSGRKGRPVNVSFRCLGKLAHCSPTTAQQAVSELLNHGYISMHKSYRYSRKHGRMIFDTNQYLWLRRSGGYTMIRRDVLRYQITPAAFCILLTLYRYAGRTGRAFPSLHRLTGLMRTQHDEAGIALSTVCKALRALRKQQAIVRHYCWTRKECFAANSYYLTDMVIQTGHPHFQFMGSSISDTPLFINQITGDYTDREEKVRVSAFDRSAFDIYEKFAQASLWDDGCAIRVLADDIPLLTA